jgi:hypothetical protein
LKKPADSLQTGAVHCSVMLVLTRASRAGEDAKRKEIAEDR